MDKSIAFKLATKQGLNMRVHNIQENVGVATVMENMAMTQLDAPCHVRAIGQKCAEGPIAILSTGQHH